MIKVPAGLLTNVIQAIPAALSGPKPTRLAVTLRRTINTLREYDVAWREEKLNPAIVEFTNGGDTIPEEATNQFIALYNGIFQEEVAVDLTPIPVTDLEGLTVTDDEAFGLLLDLGVIADADTL